MCRNLAVTAAVASTLLATPTLAFEVLQPLGEQPGPMPADPSAGFYVPALPATIRWGHLPNRGAQPVLSVPSGSIVTFDTVSHEGVLEDQGRDPQRYFASHGIPADQVLDDAIAIAAAELTHDFAADGPHVVTGPIAIEGAEPGDVLKVEVLDLQPRVPYGVISNRHGKGALPGEYPQTPPQPDASPAHPERYGNVSIFTPIRCAQDQCVGVLATTPPGASGEHEITFPLQPFMGLMGVAPDTDARVHSVPPASHGGNADINEFGVGSTIYYPVQVPGALFYTGDGHYSQGDGEVSLTALEGSLRATFRLTVIDAAAAPGGKPSLPLGETPEYWVAIGLHEDLDEAMKAAVRESIRFLHEHYGISEALAYAYLSAATDFEVSQVVDGTKGIHALIRKADFADVPAPAE